MTLWKDILMGRGMKKKKEKRKLTDVFGEKGRINTVGIGKRRIRNTVKIAKVVVAIEQSSHFVEEARELLGRRIIRNSARSGKAIVVIDQGSDFVVDIIDLLGRLIHILAIGRELAIGRHGDC